MKRVWPFACVVLGLMAPVGARAQTDGDAPRGDEVTLEQLYGWVDGSPRILAAEEEADADLGDVTAAGTPENPVLSYDVWGLIWGEQTNGGSQHQFTVSQTFPWPGQLDARVRAARARHAADRSHVDLLRAALRLELRRAFVQLLAAQERTRLLEEQETLLGTVAQVVRGRSEAGAGRRWDAIRADAELATIRAARDASAADESAAAGRLAMLLGRPDWTPRAAGTWAELPLPEAPVDDAPASDHPALTSARRETEAAEASLTSEHAMAIPAFQLRLGTLFSTWPEGGYLYGGIAMPLPFFDQNQGAIERAEHEVSAARATEDATRRELSAAVRAARRTLAQRREALSAYDAGAIASLPEVVSMAEVAYRGGQIEVFELLDAVRSTRALVLDRVGHQEAVQEAEIDLLEASLGLP